MKFCIMHGSDWGEEACACNACYIDGVEQTFTPACISGTKEQLEKLNSGKAGFSVGGYWEKDE